MYHETSVACSKIEDSQLKDPSEDEKLSTNALIEEVKPIGAEKFEAEYCCVSNLISFLAFLDYLCFKELSIDPLMQKVPAESFRIIISFKKRNLPILLIFLGFWACQISDAKQTLMIFFHLEAFSSKTLLI